MLVNHGNLHYRHKVFRVAHRRYMLFLWKQFVDCVTKELRSIPAFEITQNRAGELFQKQITNLYSVLLNYFAFIIWSLFLQRYSAIVLFSTIMHQCRQRYTIKYIAGLSHTNLKFLPLSWLAYPCLLTSLR